MDLLSICSILLMNCNHLPINHDTIKGQIVAISEEYNFDSKKALRIAACESQYGTQLFNQQSTAKGVYQFIDKTWKNYCTGDVLNYEDNIRCFLKLYPDHKNWWVCKG